MEPIVLDKTADGRYWTLDGWVDQETVLRLRFDYASNWDPFDVQAQVGVVNGRDIVWTPVGRVFGFALGCPDFSADVEWATDFPDIWQGEFVELGRVLGRIGHHLDLGPALGINRLAEAEP